ncbi:MAG: hypothetical protein MUF42_07560 [Cytophagaceae bacterium]|jgi:hypothetical protein|nr:hypothetical protein [Cytophagaceae bacterium]
MGTTKVHLSDLHQDHKRWKQRLSFYDDELAIYQRRLEEISSKNSDVEIKKKVDHFANQFLIQRNEQIKLRQRIDAHESLLADNVKANPIASDHRLFDDHDALREGIHTQDSILENLKKEFIRFCEQVL